MTERTVIESISQSHVLSVQPQASAFEAACLMTKGRCGSVLIVDAGGAMLGILTERDLMIKIVARRRDPETTPVSEIMTHNPHFISPSKILGVFSIRDAMARELVEAESMADLIDQQFTNVLS
jgi:CBS domain-containing protein